MWLIFFEQKMPRCWHDPLYAIEKTVLYSGSETELIIVNDLCVFLDKQGEYEYRGTLFYYDKYGIFIFQKMSVSIYILN